MQLFATCAYERAICKLISEKARLEMEAVIATYPNEMPIIPGTGGIRKMRWAGSGRGKRGGIRAVYFYHTSSEVVYLLGAYAKSNREDLSPSDKKALSKLVVEIKRERKKK